VALFSIRGGNQTEEILLNGAGFLAPVVAFVPTAWPSTYCSSKLPKATVATLKSLLSGNQFLAKFAANNLATLIVGGMIAVAVAWLVAGMFKVGKDSRQKELVVPALGSGVVVLAGFIWHKVSPGYFWLHAHSYAAIFMFAVMV
jgi:hypothetical protein